MSQFCKSIHVILTLVVLGAGPISLQAVTSGVTDGENFDLRSGLGPVEMPDLTGLDQKVAVQLGEARKGLEIAIAEPDAGARRLATAYGALGQLYHAYELFDVAMQCYRNAIVLEPQNFEWFHLAADVARQQSDFETAVELYGVAWSLQSNDFAALVRLGEAHLELGQLDEAETAFRRALTLSPDSPSVMAGLGELALSRRQYEAAVDYFSAVLRASPEATRFHYSIAMAYRGLGEMEKAKSHLDRRGTVGVRPSDPVVDQLELLIQGERVRLVRGKLAYDNGLYRQAADEFAAAVAADPGSARALVNLGTSLAQLGEEEEAVAAFERALEIDADQTTAHYNLGTILAGQGRAEEALPHLRSVVEETPYDAEAQLAFARALVGTGMDEESLEHFRKAAELNPGSEGAVLGGVSALVRLRRFVQAKSVLEAGHRRMPESGEINYALARLLALCPDKDLRDGGRALEIVETLFGDDPSPRNAQLMAQALAELDRCEEAALWQERILDAAINDGVTEVVEGLRSALEVYRKGPPCRAPSR